MHRCIAAALLEEGLGNISRAPLKPQQRMFIVTNNLIPSLYHQLVLTATSKKYLKGLHRSVQAAVQSWLKLPKDTPKAYFHAKIFDGGLGIVTLEHQVPLMKIKCIDRLWGSDDPVICEMLSTDGAESLLARQREPTRYREVQITNRESLRVALATDLHSSIDGRGLRESDLVPHQHHWVNEASGLLSGANYIGAVKVRGNLLPSAVRAARGRPHISILCGACRRPGSLGHILQVCPRTHASRVARHDRLASLVQSAAGKAGWSCIREPAIPTLAGIRRPDLIFYHQDRSTHVLSWRGLMARASADTLCSDLVLGRQVLSLLSAVTCERSLWIWQHFHRSGFVLRG